jgi:hypothetical protein
VTAKQAGGEESEKDHRAKGTRRFRPARVESEERMRRSCRRLGGSEAHGPRILSLLTLLVALAFLEAGASEPLLVGGQAEPRPSPADSLASRLAIPPTLAGARPLPLAPSKGYERHRFQPSVNFGLGLRTFDPDLSGFAGLLGATPSIDLSPVTCVFIEFNLSDLISIQADAGTLPGSAGTDGHQGLLGLVAYPRLFPHSRLRPCIGAGVSFCQFDTQYSGFRIHAGTEGWYATAGLEYRVQGPVVQLYACYSSMERISTIVESDTVEERVRVSMDLSSVMFGIRLKI